LFAFGGGSDFRIYNECNTNAHSFSMLGGDYEPPEGMKYSTPDANAYLAGKYQFKVLEIEVYQLLE
jgi:hypothetical protein